MRFLNNLFIMFFLILVIIIAIKVGVEHKKPIKKPIKKPKKSTDNLDLCFKNCNSQCDQDLNPRFFDACTRKCAIRCGNKFS